MREHTRSIFHSVLLFIFIFSQVTVQPVSAAVPDKPPAAAHSRDQQNALSEFSEATSGPEPAGKDFTIVPAENFKSADSALQVAAELQLLAYTLPAYPIQSAPNGLSIEPLVAYNLIVDSNVLAPSSYGPSAATFGARYCNTGTSSLMNVRAYIGNYDSNYNGTLGEVGDAVPGSFPRRTSTAPAYDPAGFAAAYGASTTNPLVGSTHTDYGATNAPFALALASGTTPPEVDASRYLGTLEPGQCRTEYWMITYPRKACSSGTVCDVNNGTRKDVTGGVKPDDDLWLPYFFWATSATVTSYRWNAVTMRNEISAMANKIWPNGDNKVPDEYVAAIAEVVGWDTLTPSGTSDVYPGERVVSQGIWYDLGNVGAGFDNNGDFVPDRNIWVQPIGDASGYDPGCFRLVRTYGLVIVKLNDGTEQLIPFVDQMYFENIPDNNNGAVGLVYYEYAALDGVCTASLTPYQEVASGYDNEKFNADYGAGIPPLQSRESNMTLDKTGPNTIGLTGTISYSLTFTLPDINSDPANTTTVVVGQPSYGAPLTYSDAVPVGLQYVANSATLTVDMSSSYPAGDIPADLWHSRDAGATWIQGDPGNYTSTAAGNQLVLQWRLQSGVESPANGAAYTGTVQFQAVVPGTYNSVRIENEACLKIGQGPGFVCDPHTTVVTGNSSITGLVWRDDAVSSGVPGNALQEGTEAGIPSVTVNLYWDNNGDGDYVDAGDFLYATTNSLNYAIIDGYVDVNGGGITATDDAALSGITIVDGGLDLNGDGAANGTDDGFFGGYVVIDGRIDRDASGLITATDDGTLAGVYNFGSLPATTTVPARYIVVVDQRDSEIPAGYGPTTPTSYSGINLAANTAYGDAANGSEPSDFGFGPALAIDKYISPTSYLVGDTLAYTINVTNLLPGAGDGTSACSYRVWASRSINDASEVPEGSSNNNGRWHNVGNNFGSGAEPVYITGRPDGLKAYTDMANSNNYVGLTGYNLGSQAGNITSVKFVVYAYEYEDTQTDDALIVDLYYGNSLLAPAGTYSYNGSYFTQPVGSLYVIQSDITSRRASWSWSDFSGELTEMRLTGNKGGGTLGDFEVDAAGFIITTSGTCGGASQTLNPVPLTDTFDDNYFDFISADPPVSTTATGTLTWNNVGPLYAGQTRTVTVYMRAQSVGTAPNTTNTATSTNARFSNGLPANSPVSDTATVTVSANNNTRSLTGRVFDDNNTNGWQTALWTAANSETGYDTGDAGIQYIPVDLYGCLDNTTNLLITTEGSNKTCAEQGGTWRLLRTTSTNSSGDYTFGNLAAGYYRVRVRSSVIVGAQTADVNASGSCGTGCDGWSNAENDLLSTATFVGDVDDYTAVTRVNFGYNVPSGAYDIGDLVFYDWDGDGVQDAEDEPMPGVTVRLLAADGTALTTTNTTGNYYFLDRAPAYYTVEIVTTSLPAGVVQTKDPDATMDNKSTFALTADKLDVDFGYRPYGSGTIGDTVFKDINGNGVQDGTGETGLAGVTVALQVDWDGNGTYVTVKTTTTDANGKYLFTGLPQGTYRVAISPSASAAAIPDDAFGNNYFPSNGTDTGSVVYMDKTLATSTSSDLTADFGFAPPASIGDTVYQDIDRDGTQDLNEPGINGITVTLYTFADANNNRRYDPGEALTSTGRTEVTATVGERQGVYQFDGLKPGYYTVQVTPPAGSTLTGDPNTDGFSCDGLHNPADPGEPSLVLCDHRDGMRLYNGTNYMGADFGYYLSGALGDLLWIDSNNNGIRETTESGIPNVTVRLCNDTACTGGGDLETVTDSDGYYYFTNIPDGTYYVVVDTTDTDLTARGLTQTYESYNNASGDNAAAADPLTQVHLTGGMVDQINGAACTSCSLDLDFGYRYLGNTTISGTVCLETTVDGVCGDGLADPSGVGAGETAYRSVTVFLYLLSDTNGNGRFDTGETTSMVSSTTTTPSGDFAFNNLGDGVYYIVAIGAPQNGLELTSSQTSVNTGGDDSATTSYVETTSFDGSTLSAYQVVNTTGDTSVTDRDFAFRLDGNYDFGDLPGSYSTLLSGSPDGARHLIAATPDLYFGPSGATQASLIDTDGAPTSDASGDGADENGIFIYTDATNGAENADGWTDGVGVIQFDIVGSGWLVGWMDFDGDGSFSDGNEMIINRAVSSGQDQNLAITTPTSSISGTHVYARFRLFPSQPAVPSLAFSGEASGGEVEDYRFPVGGGVVTPITLAYFQAQRRASEIRFAWSTAMESGNIGFNLYVVTQDGGSLQLNQEMILSKGIDTLTRQDYTYNLNAGGNRFYLEEVSVLGETRLHGPFQLGQKYGGLPEEAKIDLPAVQKEHLRKFVERQTALKKYLNVPADARQSIALIPFTTFHAQLQNTLNLKVNKTGLYRVTYEMLKAAGLDIAGVPASKLMLIRRGQAVPIYVKTHGKGASQGRWGPADYFEFYGEALDTLYTDTNIYTVQVSRSAAPRVESHAAAPVRAAQAPASFIDTRVVNHQIAYANHAAGADPWYDTSMLAMTYKSWNFSFQLDELVDTSISQSLELNVWGATDWPEADPDHHLIVRVNGVPVADAVFDGIVEHTLRTSLPAGTLRVGANTLELILPADTGAEFDVITLDRFKVGYSRSFRAQNGRLTFTAADKLFTVTNLPSKEIVVYRLDGARLTRLEQVKVQQTGSTFSASFAGTNKVATYLVSAAEALYTPAMEATRPVGDLTRPAQYLIITHPDFAGGLQPLIQARRAQGLTVSVVDVNDLYAKYSYGVFDPQAIKQYIAYAKRNLGTQYVLLVGGDTYDYRNYLGRNSISFIPSLYTATGQLSRFVPVDPLYGDVDGDNVPDLAIGRFPVRTSAELNLMVAKTLAYASKDYGRIAVFASDKFDGTESFKSISLNLSSGLPADWSSRLIHMDDLPVAAAREQLLAAMNKGAALVTYTGHSAPTVWSFSRLFQTQHAEALTNAGKPFVAVQWGCFNTYYVDPVNKTLLQSLLFSGDRGAAAVMGASTRTDSASEEALGVLITPRLVTPGMTVGRAMQDAKAELAREHPELLDVLLGWTLIGDPALIIQQ